MAVSKDRLDFIEQELAKIERELNTHTKQLQEDAGRRARKMFSPTAAAVRRRCRM